MDELKQRIERLSEQRREALRRLAPDEFERLFASPDAADNVAEEALLKIWSEVLGVPVTCTANYFELGGDSVLSVAIVAKSRACGLPITARLLFANPTVRQLAAALMQEKAACEPSTESPERASAPLTPLQQGMVFHSLHDAGRAAYISQLSATLPGKLERTKVERAWTLLTQRHVVLRASLDMSDPLNPRLRAQDGVKPMLRYRTLEGASAQQVQQGFERFLAEDLAEEFDLQQAPLMRLTFLESATEYRCVWTHHHLILDGWSQQVLLQEFHALYDGLSLPTATHSFFDYAQWLAEHDSAPARTFWREYLRGAATTAWPTHADHKAADSALEQSTVRLSFAANELIAHAQRLRVTPAIVLESAWSLVLGEVLRTSNVSFGMTASVRPAELAGSEQIVGLCINTLPLRIVIPDSGEVKQWLVTAQLSMQEWLHHAHASLSSVLRWGHVNAQLFDTLLVFENLPRMSLNFSGTTGASLRDVRATVREHYSIVLVVTPGPEFTVELKYAQATIFREQALQALELFDRALRALLEESEMSAVRARVAAELRSLTQARQEIRSKQDRQRLVSAQRTRISTMARQS